MQSFGDAIIILIMRILSAINLRELQVLLKVTFTFRKRKLQKMERSCQTVKRRDQQRSRREVVKQKLVQEVAQRMRMMKEGGKEKEGGG